jgi:hypothetical protein
MTRNGLALPERPGDLTPEWLTGALRHSGALTNGRITGASFEPLGVGAGFIGQIGRLTLTYDDAAADGPVTVIAKMPSLEEGARAIASLYGLYERELRFYRELADRIAIRTPRLYYGDGDPDRVAYILLFEDLSATGTVGDQVKGCSGEQARLALEQLARHHAMWWGAEQLRPLAWLQPGVDLVEAAMKQSYPASWPKALEAFGQRMSPAVRDALPELGRRVMERIAPYRDGPLTLVHGDYRLDNMFFGGPDADYDLAVVDWQSPNLGWGAYDIAYFMYGNIDIDTRRAHEHEVLRRYHEILLEHGVRDYSWERLLDDYVASLVVSLAIWVVNAATLDTANERGMALFELFFDRLGAAIADHNALARLPA